MQPAPLQTDDSPDSSAVFGGSPRRRRKSRRVAVVTAFCTGCGGAPVCRVYCKYDALQLVEDPETYPLKRMTVNEKRCVGCGACVAAGREGLMLTGCPWNAIRLVTA